MRLYYVKTFVDM